MEQKNEGKFKIKQIAIVVLILFIGVVIGNLMPNFLKKDTIENNDIRARRLTTGSTALQKLNAVIFFQGTKKDLKSADITPNIATKLMLDGREISESSLNEIFSTINKVDEDDVWMRCQNHYNGYIDTNWKPDCIIVK